MDTIRDVGYSGWVILRSVPMVLLDLLREANLRSRRMMVLVLGPKITETIYGAIDDRILEGRPLSARLDEVKSISQTLDSLALLVRITMDLPPSCTFIDSSIAYTQGNLRRRRPSNHPANICCE
jgi:hypothetical protein